MKKNTKNKLRCCIATCLLSSLSFAGTTGITDLEYHPLYVGGLGGYGTTTWYGLVPSDDNQNDALRSLIPIGSREGGAVWGVFVGLEATPNFAVEVNYMHYPNAQVFFDKFSVFSVDHDGATALTTKAETVNMMAKILFPIPQTMVRLYSAVGVGALHRNDIIMNEWLTTPTFSAGINYNLTSRIIGEIGGNYTAGFGESQLTPTDSYFPFLYSGFVRLAYRI